jgi:Arabinose-binding domain of AraC transcription regulator, N-term
MRDPGTKRLGPLPSANGAITRLACARAKEAGVDLELLLKKAGLTLRQLEDPNVRLRVRDQITFLNLAADALHDDLLGFHLAQLPDLRKIGLLYYVAASSQMLSMAVERAARYSSVINEGVSIKYIDARDIVIAFRYVGVSRHHDRHQIEFFMVTLIRLCRQLTGRHVEPLRVSLTHRRNSDRSEYVKFFGGEVEFGAGADEITLAPAIKEMPIGSADVYLNNSLIKYFDEALSRRQKTSSSFQSSVENAIVPLLPHGTVRVSEIACRLGETNCPKSSWVHSNRRN